VDHRFQSDEIDLLAIGPYGVRVIEFKHWTDQWMASHKSEVEHEADKLTMKARKVGTSLRRIIPDIPRVDGSMLLTQDPSKMVSLKAKELRGVTLHTLNDWKPLLGAGTTKLLSPQQMELLAKTLEPRSPTAVDGSMRRLAGYVNLELQTRKTDRFHRIYRGSHPTRRDRIMLHLYDLSASEEKTAAVKASREFDSLLALQIFPWAPRVLDSYQDVPGYEEEMFFFTIVDPEAPRLEDRTKDTTWTTLSRITFARNATRALEQLHSLSADGAPSIHRNLSPGNLLVKYDDTVILTGFELSKLEAEVTVASNNPPEGISPDILSPEVRTQGLAAADQRSDLYSLSACLRQMFEGREDQLSEQASEALKTGLSSEPGDRGTLQDLDSAFTSLLGESIPPPSPPPPRFWTEDQVIRFGKADYRIVSRLGSGGIGTAFKVTKLDRATKEDRGTYVAKVAHEEETGRRVLDAYSLVRPYLRHASLSTIFEVAEEWKENEFVALMTWVSGAPLAEFTGLFQLLAEDQQDETSESLALRWLLEICEGLEVLHRSGLVHGDISPRNMIVSSSDLVLTDYDFVGRIGEHPTGPGTISYSSPTFQDGGVSSPSDDFYALSASFFQVIFERDPFIHDNNTDKKEGLNWDGINREEFPILSAFMDKATHPDAQSRFGSFQEVQSALQYVRPDTAPTEDSNDGTGSTQVPESSGQEESGGPPVELKEQEVKWLNYLLQSYPGSRFGNRETRGLDTEFASETYVETLLEETLEKDIRNRKVQLIILCGNAGDGKTALLQHLSAKLGLGEHSSSDRILEGQVKDGPYVRMNLDGSASWQDQSADELLDKFLAPFSDGKAQEDIAHLLAINDGRLLEWIERVEKEGAQGETPLTIELNKLLEQGSSTYSSGIRFVNLNQRSLVGGVDPGRTKINTQFLQRLVNQLYGGDQSAGIWSPCEHCVANSRCEVYRAASLFAPESHPAMIDPTVGASARQRLFEALQAVHLAGDTHITMRELRATLVYILFGIHNCHEYYLGDTADVFPYWDRAFSANTPARQGEVLLELARFDPALEAHPNIDRMLLNTNEVEGNRSLPLHLQNGLASYKRQAYFEWPTEKIEGIAGTGDAFGLARGRHLERFRNLAFGNESHLIETCTLLCQGISRLEDLPAQALDHPDVVPLRITPRTPTETAFWVEKPLHRFHLEPKLPQESEGIDQLHRQADLVYVYRDGQTERLRLGAELFHLLLELADGYQLGDVSTDASFAHLSIFVQRLVREDERALLAWNPAHDESIYEIHTAMSQTRDGRKQKMIISPRIPGDD